MKKSVSSNRYVQSFEAQAPTESKDGEKELMTELEAAKFLGFSPLTVRKWRLNGQIPCRKMAGCRPIYSRTALKRFFGIEGNATDPAPISQEAAATN